MKTKDLQRLKTLVGSIDILIQRLERPEYSVVEHSRDEAIRVLRHAQGWVDEMAWLVKREHWESHGRIGRPPGKRG